MLTYSKNHYFQNNEHFYIDLNQGTNFENHTHDFIEIVYITKGSAMQHIGESEYPVKKGTILFINCGQTHSFTSPKLFSYYNLMLSPEFISNQLVNSGNLKEMLSLSMFEEFQSLQQNHHPLAELPGDMIPEVDLLFAALLREYRGTDPGRTVLIRSYLTAVLTHIFRCVCKPDETVITPLLLEYIEQHCSEKLTLNSLAKKCFYNPSYLSRMFHELQGQTLTDYIRTVRIKKAMVMLETTGLSIEEIRISCGIGDKTFFYRKFREETGFSPAEYRQFKKTGSKSTKK